MAQNDSTDMMAAFAIGTIAGIAAVLMLRPSSRTRIKRIEKDLEPHRRKMRRSAKRARRGIEQTAAATADLRGELGAAGQALVRDFQTELSDLLASARDEISRTVEDQVAEARKTLRRSVRQLTKS